MTQTVVLPEIVATPTNLTVEDLADEFRTTAETVHYWVKVGKAPRSFKVGRRRLFARADVDAWLEAAKGAVA